MKLNVLAVAVITAFAVGTANAAVPESWTVGGAAGWAHGFDHSFPSVDDGEKLKFKDDGYGIKLYGEYNFTNWFGLGLGYNFIGGQKLKATDVNTGETDTQKMHANIGEMYGRFAYPFDNNGSDVFFKVGPSFNWFSSGETKFKLGAVAGIGAQWAITRNLALRGGFDYFYRAAKEDVRIDEGLLYVGFQYTFGGPAAPAPVQKVKASQTHTLDAGVLFPFDSAKLSADGQSAVANVVQSANSMENPEFEVYGYTDRIGTDAYNLKLSDKRADAVSAELQNNGVTPKVSDGKGKANPVTGNKCDGVKGRKALIDCLAPDRRVEIVVTGETTATK
ncbi:OmpA-OmpF porin, OOP family [Succinivibrio dextrinosolvens DSM 3072]|uniref:OmpA-OmpF porin, OOP family n=1 Tax=Succinivibrio dextrinosolvens DSM 3072 TaxID=1123324 RepID=A0A1T4UVF0_9GAMM|nr:OmpA family protein [Succinivibrio dextrinosolvens]SKA56660.1 OmpA-OmpF porin, OOP family [Succinivibrio dextrinosolvens DSM 3072]